MEHSALSLLALATEVSNMGDMWGNGLGANRGDRMLSIVEAINRVESMQKSPPLVRWAARLPSKRTNREAIA